LTRKTDNAAATRLWRRWRAHRARVKAMPLVKVTIKERRNPWV
jgi:hypothetical protein